jgi:hypothetical protein
VITYREVYPLLVAACPSFVGSKPAESADENDGEFLRIGYLVRHLILLLEDLDTESFSAVFGVVEWVLTEGDAEARSLINAGFLDDLTNPETYAHATRSPADFVRWLGPEACGHPSVQRLL